MRITKKQKTFIRETLIPFILRHEGAGFAMNRWKDEYLISGQTTWADNIGRTVPPCGTVACIGGSTQFLCKLNTMSSNVLGRRLGLTAAEAQGLFYGYDGPEEGGLGWPRRYRIQFYRADTPLAKAKIAVKMLEKVIETNGKILHTKGK